MLKSFVSIFIMYMLLSVTIVGQEKAGTIVSVNDESTDDNRLKGFLSKAGELYFTKPDSALNYAQRALALAKQLNKVNLEIKALNVSGEMYRFLGDFPHSLDAQFKALELNRQSDDKKGEATTLSFIGLSYTEFKQFPQAKFYLKEAIKICDSLIVSLPETIPENKKQLDFIKVFACFATTNIGAAYEGMNILDSALYFQQLTEKKYKGGVTSNMKSLILTRIGNIYAKLGQNDAALESYNKSLQNAYAISDRVNPTKIKYYISETYMALGDYDSSLFYARNAIAEARISSQKLFILEASNQLVKLFRHQMINDSIIYYQDISIAMRDSLFGPEKYRQLQLLTLAEQEKQQEIAKKQEQYQNRIRVIALLSILTFLLATALLLYRNNIQKQKANALLQEQKKEIQETLTKLTATQKQLIQSEKMASLGELTAGVAHEIQNPLNFVNNFSDLNNELMNELRDASKQGDAREIEKLIEQLIENESKINFHGKRADAIVKNMLQHSRNSSANKESIDINKLTDEYVRLSYHGMRAKEKTFNVELDLQYDPTAGSIQIIPQDIGRVLLNILNNAFYAVHMKRKNSDEKYNPEVSVKTERKDDNLRITIADNGDGIPDEIKDKIFQPFFTTKPTGDGTGLGLSLCYDIIKTHLGEIYIETPHGGGASFNIVLPV